MVTSDEIVNAVEVATEKELRLSCYTTDAEGTDDARDKGAGDTILPREVY